MTTFKVPKTTSEENDEDYEDSDEDNENIDEKTSLDEISPKRRIVALILSILLGIYGAHRFYAGKLKTGFLQLIVTLSIAFLNYKIESDSDLFIISGIISGIVFLWAFIDFILICIGRFKDKNGARIKNW